MKFIKDNFDINIDYMANTFRPKYSHIVESIHTGNVPVKIQKVINSNFNLYAKEGNTRRSKAVRLTENLLSEVSETLTDDFEMPRTVVLDFKLFGVDAIGGYDRPSNTMFINSKYNTKNKMQKYLSKNEGFFADTSVYVPIKHELGHKFYYDVIVF